jgi:hypothetical protein
VHSGVLADQIEELLKIALIESARHEPGPTWHLIGELHQLTRDAVRAGAAWNHRDSTGSEVPSFVFENRIVRDDGNGQHVGRAILCHAPHDALASTDGRIADEYDHVRRIHANRLFELRSCRRSDGDPMAPKRFPQRGLHRLALAHHQESRPVLLIRHHRDGGRFWWISPA